MLNAEELLMKENIGHNANGDVYQILATCLYNLGYFQDAKICMKFWKKYSDDEIVLNLEKEIKKCLKLYCRSDKRKRSSLKRDGAYYRPKRTCFNIKCSNLETYPKEFKCCGGCQRAYYCSANCQRQHWTNFHKFHCKKSSSVVFPNSC